jgi:TolB-like protein/predicted Ser/Thr protein kinase
LRLQPGANLGPYQILSPLGAGGMGEVWKARDTRLNRIVAIKQLKSEQNERFEKEAHAIAALSHPHICVLYDIGADYLVMEYVEGRPLRGPVAPGEATRLAIQIASALEAAHQKGVLHRDLKPANVLVSGGQAKLLDFGIAKLMAEAETAELTRTGEGTVLGTVAYMSPEQAKGQALDERSDIFSFGALLHELLSGSQAFPGASTAEVLSAVLRDEPAPLHGADALASIVARCLRKAPVDRFQRMAEVRMALQRLTPAANAPRPSIAVLPFADMSPGKDHEYFSDGLAEEIINALAKVPGLKVIARTSAFAFKGQQADIRTIADKLGVGHVLEGSVRKAGDRVRVTAQLITAADGSPLWSDRYDRELADFFVVQDEIAAAITGALKATLAGPTPGRQYTPTLAAYEALLKARHYQWQITPTALMRSREYFEQAIAADSGYALAYGGLSLHYFMLAMYSVLPAHHAMPLVRANAQRAVDLDPELPDAHAMLGLVAALYEYDWDLARNHFATAMARDPVPPAVRSAYGLFFLMNSGRAAEAVGEIRRALGDDPLSVALRYHLAVCLLANGQLTESAGQLRHVLELDDTFVTALALLSVLHAAREELDEARRYAEQAFALGAWDPVIVGIYAAMLVRSGDNDKAGEVLAALRDGSTRGQTIGFVTYHLLSDEIDAAADWLEKAIDERYPGVMFFVNLPYGSALRSSDRWPPLAARMHLPEAS